ncbi:MAG: hypothetical protein ACXWV5_04270 [Flavitalea sp.]
MISRFAGVMLLLFYSITAFPQNNSVSSGIKLKTTRTFDNLNRYLYDKSSSNSAFQALSNRMDALGLSLYGCLSGLEDQDLYSRKDKKAAEKYYDEIENYNSLMTTAMLMDNPDSISVLLDYIEKDLYIKYEPESNDPELRKARLVRVKVRVLDSLNKEQFGFMVFVKPEISLNPSHIETFNPTNNAEKEIAPGRKLIWIERNGIRINERKEGIRKSTGLVMVDFILK